MTAPQPRRGHDPSDGRDLSSAGSLRRIPGEFVPLAVHYAHDRDLRTAGPMAELLFVRGLAYVKRMRGSAGLVPDYDLPVVGVGIPNPAKHAATLVREGLWHEVDGGWLIRSWSKWNPRSEAHISTQQSRGGSLGNHNRWHRNGRRSDDCAFCGPPATDSAPDRGTDSLPDRCTDHHPESPAIAEEETEGETEKGARSLRMHPSSRSVGREQPVDDSGRPADHRTGWGGR